MRTLDLFKNNQGLSFRSDINGLRAIAVLPVLFFHSKVEWMKGGYLGVDVFFVISGYLIALQLFTALQNNKFSFADFYLRRARRLVPAYLVVAVVTTVFAIIFMLPYNLKNYGQSLVASSLAFNNILLYLTSGYWSSSADFKPLYHTWSLAIEEQFYFFIPLIFYILRDKLKIIFFLCAAFFTSFYFFALTENLEFRFLSLHTRAWELLAGAILAFLLKDGFIKNNNIAVFGLLLIFAGYTLPGIIYIDLIFLNVMAVMGTLIIISFSDQNCTFVGKFLSNKLFSLIGLLSYGIYLWHQPLLAFVRLANEVEPSAMVLTLVSFLSIPLAYFTWIFVEAPLKNRIKVPDRRFLLFFILCSLSIILIGFSMHKTYGFRKINSKYDYGVNPQVYVDSPKSFIKNSFDGNKKIRMLVIGNSFARDYLNIIKESGQISNYDVVYRNIECSGIFDYKLSQLISGSDVVVFSQNWAQSEFDLNEFNLIKSCVNEAEKINTHARVIVFGVKNFGWNNNFVKFQFNRDTVDEKVSALPSVIYFDKKAKNEIKNYFSLLNFFERGKSMPIFDDKGSFLTYDSNHLTPAGAAYIGKHIMPKLTDALNNPHL